jgi:hypothetical protein
MTETSRSGSAKITISLVQNIRQATNHDSDAAISAIWNIDYFHGLNRFVKIAFNARPPSSCHLTFVTQFQSFDPKAGKITAFRVGTPQIPFNAIAIRQKLIV